MANNPSKNEVLIKHYSRSILDISEVGLTTRLHYYIPISFEYIPQIHYLNYPDLFSCWPRSSVGRAPVDLFRICSLGPNFPWFVGTPKFRLKG